MKLNQVIKLLTDLTARKWYGKLTISIEDGRISLIRKEETFTKVSDSHNTAS